MIMAGKDDAAKMEKESGSETRKDEEALI